MTWNYRVLRYADGTLALHEVYYGEDGLPCSYTEHPISFSVDAEEGRDGLVESMTRALRDATERPILDGSNFPARTAIEYPLHDVSDFPGESLTRKVPKP